jgi:hypothetical protein
LAAAFFFSGCAGHFYREEAGLMHLYLKENHAREVFFASSLDGFYPHRANKTGSGTWEITVPNTGEFRYFYLVDGSVRLPECPRREKDDFGSCNCLYKPEFQRR